MGYLPTSSSRRQAVLEKKRQEYRNLTEKHFIVTGDGKFDNEASREKADQAIFHQISIDVPRTCPELELFRETATREAMVRILYCWSIRRPASGYVQGINDILTPFFSVFASEYNRPLSIRDLFSIEVDTFWCLSKLLDGIQDNYTFSQSGIYRQINYLKEIVQRIDPILYKHFEKEGIDYVQFAFRWMNCLLLREFPLHLLVRIFDSYMAEGEDGFSTFHTFVCAAFLLKWSQRLQLLDFQDIIIFLQAPPTSHWTEKDIETLLSEAFVLKSLFSESLFRKSFTST